MTEPTQEELKLAHIVFQHAAEGVAITDPDGKVLAVNPAFTAFTGYGLNDFKGTDLSILRSGRHEPPFYEKMWRQIRERGHWQGEIWNRHKVGNIYPEWLSINAVNDANGKVQYYVGVFTDIAKIMTEQTQLRELAYHDRETGLPNRLLLDDRFDQALHRAMRDLRQLAILFIDVGIAGGGDGGENFAVAVAKLLHDHVREADTLARIGKGEFLVMLEDIDGPRSASVLANKLLKALDAPLAVGDLDIHPTANIGISLFPMDGQTLAELITAAEMAMLEGRVRSRNTYSFHSSEMTAYANERTVLERQLRTAISEETLALHYQPMFDVEGKQVIGAEALVRWTDPLLGVVAPDRFVPVAEDIGLIHPLGDWVLRTAFRQYAEWKANGAAPPLLSINISARQLEVADFEERVAAILAETNMDPKLVEFEIRESVLMEVAYVVPTLETLDRMGIRLSIDGFGTGFSSFGHLKSLPVTKLNIDRSFVRNIGLDPANESIVRAIVGMARTLGLRVIAEGVETEDQADFMRGVGCDEFQGHLLGRAVNGSDFARYFARPAA